MRQLTTGDSRPPRSRFVGVVALTIAVVLGCGPAPGGDLAGGDPVALEEPTWSEVVGPQDLGPGDAADTTTAGEVTDPAPDTVMPDLAGLDPGTDGPDSSDHDPGDTPVDTLEGPTDEANGGENPMDAPACLPDEAPCPCQEDEDCPEGAFCSGDRCRPWVCWPGSTGCLESRRILCDRNGGGYLVLEDCDDRNPCTIGDGCAGGTCLPRSAVSCDDGNPCTVDRCDTATGQCLFEPMDDLPCDDGDPCTTGDRCRQGFCVSQGSLYCGDGNPCTDDLCTSLLGCVHLPRPGACPADVVNPCVAGGECREGRCEPVIRPCDDGDPCTEDSCDASSGACRHREVAGCACATDPDCDDGDPCTTDRCQQGRCLHDPRTAFPCCLDTGDCPVPDPCIEAICQDRRCVQRPLASPACCRNPDRRWDFEAGLDDWTPFPDDQGPWRWRWMQAPGGGGALGFASEDGFTAPDGSRASGSVRSTSIDLPPGVQTRLRWRIRLDLEDSLGRDLVRLEAIQGERPVVVWERPAGFPMRLWQWLEADVSVLGGSTVVLQFSYDSVNGIPGSTEPVLVDDLSVQSGCAPAPCVVDGDCVSLGRIGQCRDGSCTFDRVLRVLGVLGDQGLTTTLATPADVVLAPDGNRVFVSDRDAHQVRVLDREGREVRTLGGPGSDPGRFLSPRGLAWSGDLLWVADSQNHRVQALTPSGIPVLVLGRKGMGPGEFLDPRGVALSEDGDRVFVADTGNHRVQSLSRWGVPRWAAGAYGTSSGRFRTPSCVAVLPEEHLIVCDSQNNRLQVLGPDGSFLEVLRPLQGPALALPYYAAVSSDGSVWVADSQNHRVVHLARGGRLLWTFGAFGSDREAFRFPMGLAPGSDGDVWVVDSGNRRVVRLGYGPWP